MTTLQDFIKLRKRLGYTAKDVSEAFGLHKNYISRVENEERAYRHIYYLALLGMSMSRK